MVKCYDCGNTLDETKKTTVIRVKGKALRADGYKCIACGMIYVEIEEIVRLFELLRLS